MIIAQQNGRTTIGAPDKLFGVSSKAKGEDQGKRQKNRSLILRLECFLTMMEVW